MPAESFDDIIPYRKDDKEIFPVLDARNFVEEY
jgi:hypothetical protein